MCAHHLGVVQYFHMLFCELNGTVLLYRYITRSVIIRGGKTLLVGIVERDDRVIPEGRGSSPEEIERVQTKLQSFVSGEMDEYVQLGRDGRFYANDPLLVGEYVPNPLYECEAIGITPEMVRGMEIDFLREENGDYNSDSAMQ